MDGQQKYEAHKVNVYNDDELRGFSWKSFGLGILITINIILMILVFVLFLRIDTLEDSLHTSIKSSKIEIIQLIKDN